MSYFFKFACLLGQQPPILYLFKRCLRKNLSWSTLDPTIRLFPTYTPKMTLSQAIKHGIPQVLTMHNRSAFWNGRTSISILCRPFTMAVCGKCSTRKYLVFPSVRFTMKIHSKHFLSTRTSLLSQMLWMSSKSSQELTKAKQRYTWSEVVKQTESQNASRTGLVSHGTVPNSERAVFCRETQKLARSGRVETFRLVT